MAIIGKDGLKYSYDSHDLIQELEADIAEFGNETVRAYYKKKNATLSFPIIIHRPFFVCTYIISETSHKCK